MTVRWIGTESMIWIHEAGTKGSECSAANAIKFNARAIVANRRT